MGQKLELAIFTSTLCLWLLLRSSFAADLEHVRSQSNDHERWNEMIMTECPTWDNRFEPPAVQNVKCLGEGICLDADRECSFTCVQYKIECCRDESGNVEAQESPRGNLCCSGAGLYNPQTHKCSNGSVTELPTTQNCSAVTQYNIETQMCCPAKSPADDPKVYNREDGYSCCGASYVRGSLEGCCDNQPFNLETQCCKNRRVVSCDDSPRRDCSKEAMNRQLEKWNATVGFHVTFLEMGSRENKRRDIRYTIASARQLTERNGKLQASPTRMVKTISLPNRHCFGILNEGESYILLTKTKLRRNTKLRELKFFIRPLDSSDMFAFLFGLSR